MRPSRTERESRGKVCPLNFQSPSTFFSNSLFVCLKGESDVQEHPIQRQVSEDLVLPLLTILYSIHKLTMEKDIKQCEGDLKEPMKCVLRFDLLMVLVLKWKDRSEKRCCRILNLLIQNYEKSKKKTSESPVVVAIGSRIELFFVALQVFSSTRCLRIRSRPRFPILDTTYRHSHLTQSFPLNPKTPLKNNLAISLLPLYLRFPLRTRLAQGSIVKKLIYQCLHTIKTIPQFLTIFTLPHMMGRKVQAIIILVGQGVRSPISANETRGQFSHAPRVLSPFYPGIQSHLLYRL